MPMEESNIIKIINSGIVHSAQGKDEHFLTIIKGLKFLSACKINNNCLHNAAGTKCIALAILV